MIYSFLGCIIPMGTWKKILLWLGAAVVLSFGGCIAIMEYLFSDMCANTVFDQVQSPSGKYKAVLFQIDCGAATDFNSQVVIVDGGFDTSEPKSLPKSFFVADRDHGRAPAGLTRGPEVKLTWLSDERLELQYHQFARIFRSESDQRGVAVKYITFQ
ncbi:hypothetical protein VX159_02875 [Dechloromonas sp. ZY10]|uniref:hypothetical protein n=1 Tax=Dechloromonas aquae TaxID=2664436 RepID=UPI0035280650